MKMQFYQTIIDYYDDIFPLKKQQVRFAKNIIEKNNLTSLLDIGCATGAFANEMSNEMLNVDAFDLNEGMVNAAIKKYGIKRVPFKSGNMLKLDDLYKDKSFDMITCFGNTLVHLTHDEAELALNVIRKHLKGVFVVQILNYDYVIDENISELPIIDNEKIIFKRFYDIKNPDKIKFQTILDIKNINKRIENTITLYPIRKNELYTMLKKAGFDKIIYYRNYNEDGANGQHLPLIVVTK